MGLCDALSKIILGIFNLLLLLVGLGPLICGIIALADENILKDIFEAIPGMEEIAQIVDLAELISNYAIFFIIFGAIVTAIGLIGFVGVCCKAKCLLYVYLTLLILLVVAEVVIIIIAAAYPETFENGAEDVFRLTFKDITDCSLITVGSYSKLVCPNINSTSVAWNQWQFDMKCCGLTGFRDYNDTSLNWYPRGTGALAPSTCCKHKSTDKLGLDGAVEPITECFQQGNIVSEYNQQGCVAALIEWAISSPWFIGIMAGIGALELIIIASTIAIACKNKKN